MKTLVFNITGHRPKGGKLCGYNMHVMEYEPLRHQLVAVVDAVVRKAMQDGCQRVRAYTGMAQGVDLIFAEEMLKYRTQCPVPFRLHAVMPCTDQTKAWVKYDRDGTVETYNEILAQVDDATYVHHRPYLSPQDMDDRNKWMVKRASLTIAVWDGSTGGTYNCIVDAVDAGNDVIVIPWPDVSAPYQLISADAASNLSHPEFAISEDELDAYARVALGLVD